ncbi:hypothetical protein ABN034_20115 [Actinopolymorpha sp. B11F2]|uniref:hypothetical protein n=1 Tax=Actinopolymorpha sp. B11F2 TaxID=3160862 RepID=UPI0032E410A7
MAAAKRAAAGGWPPSGRMLVAGGRMLAVGGRMLAVGGRMLASRHPGPGSIQKA